MMMTILDVMILLMALGLLAVPDWRGSHAIGIVSLAWTWITGGALTVLTHGWWFSPLLALAALLGGILMMISINRMTAWELVFFGQDA